MATNKFLRNDGWFQQVDSASIVPSTAATGTGFLGTLTKSTTANITINTTTFIDGPSVSQGSSGTWYVSGTVLLTNTAGSGSFDTKLWDGTTTIASVTTFVASANAGAPASLSGVIASPAGNLRMSSCAAAAGASGVMEFQTLVNAQANASTITAIRIG